MMKNFRQIIFAVVVLMGMTIALPSVMPVSSRTNAGQFHMDLWYDNSGHYSSQEAAFTQLIQNQLEKTGYFDVTLHTTDWSTFGNQIGTMPAFMLGWFYDYFDESNYIIPFEQTGYGLGTNYSNPVMDGYINTMTQTTNATERANAILNAQSMMASDPVVIPLVTRSPPLVAYTDSMNSIYLQPSDNIALGNVSKTGATSYILGTTGSIGTGSSAIDFSGCYSFDCSFPLKQMTHGIFELDPATSEAVLGPATKGYSVSPDGLNYTFNFDTTKTFVDGTNLRPEDVIWSLNRSVQLNETAGGPSALLRSYAPDGSIASGITNLQKLNSTAISVILKVRDGTLLQRLAYTNAWIFKEDSTKTWGPAGVGDRTTYGGNDYLPVGLGPYYIKAKSDFTAGEELTLTTSNYYNCGPQPKNNVTIQHFGDSQALTTALTSKTVDVGYHTFTPDDVATLKAASGINIKQLSSGFFIRYMVINVDAIPNRAVRQAMTYAIDRQEIVDVIFNGNNAPLYSMVPSGFPLGCKVGDTNSTGAPCYYPEANLAKVSSLMESQGYTQKSGNTVLTTTSNTVTATQTSVSTKTVTPGFELPIFALALIVVGVIWINNKKRRIN
jgi:ABC-type transport system substrate-binding protein